MIKVDEMNYKLYTDKIKFADINTLFALSVLERKVEGQVYADKKENPASIYIRHPYGMSLLYGESENEKFNDWFLTYLLNKNQDRKHYEWLQVYPMFLANKIDAILNNNLIEYNPDQNVNTLMNFEEKIIKYMRINFCFKVDKYMVYKEKHRFMKSDEIIVKTNEEIFHILKGSVIPKYFWDKSYDFVNSGIGFTLLKGNNTPVSTAFSSVVLENKIEIGIETLNEYQGCGYATLVCMKLIDYCLQAGYEPVWSCNASNLGSKILAEKLGFVEQKRIPYYRLPR
ncbi:MAG: hypothetical protein K0S41_3269 [Anaerocolumna sp.]|jgi:hypothetical protein|nr:hypothetical protein [Anaerocolumna sp.]